MSTKRRYGRAADALRSVRITTNFTKYAEGSVLIEMGDTRVICTASVEERVPPFLRNTGKGWVTAEYSHAAARHRPTHAERIVAGRAVWPNT